LKYYPDKSARDGAGIGQSRAEYRNNEIIGITRRIPPGQGVDEKKIESQVFRDGLKIFRRHQGLDKERTSR